MASVQQDYKIRILPVIYISSCCYNLIESCDIAKVGIGYYIQPYVALGISNSDNISETWPLYKVVNLLIL